MRFQKGEFCEKLGFSKCEFVDKVWIFAPVCCIRKIVMQSYIKSKGFLPRLLKGLTLTATLILSVTMMVAGWVITPLKEGVKCAKRDKN